MMVVMKLLFLVAGASAAPELSLLPAPLALLSGGAGDSLRIHCFAPRGFPGSTFELFGADPGAPVRSIPAAPLQHAADFVLDEAVPDSACFRCRYRSFNGSAWRSSHFSAFIAVNASSDADCAAPVVPSRAPLPPAETLQEARSWIVPVALGAAGFALLAAALAVLVWRGKARIRRAKRAQDSHRSEQQHPGSEFSLDTCAQGSSVEKSEA